MRSKSDPLVTIALPVFNGAATLSTAIRSILMQSCEHWELIILDDASTDESLEVMQSFDDPRIRLIEAEENIGLSARLNMAVDMANGRYFARMDQDDISYPDRIEKQLTYLQQHQDIDLLATGMVVFKDKGVSLGKVPVNQQHSDICSRPWNGFYMSHPTWMGRTDWFRKHRYDSSADGAEDQQLLLRTYRASRFACLVEPLLAYREGVRPLKKMLRARWIFAYAYMRQFATERCYGLVIKVAVVSLLKVAADILNLVFGVASMRNILYPLSASEQSTWQTVWHGFEVEAAGTGEPDAKG